MKPFRLFVALYLASFCVFSAAVSAQAQAPIITSIHVEGCAYPNLTMTPCPIGPGMTITIKGQNFTSGGNINLCDCPNSTVERWTSTEVVAMVDIVDSRVFALRGVLLRSAVWLETAGGADSNTVPYKALAPVITRIEVGTCSYTPNQTRNLCPINPGTQFTIVGKYFGRYAVQVATCDCASATINSWNPNWLTAPATSANTIVATAVDAVCGSSIAVQAGGVWSNPVPYTTCGN